MSEKEMFDNIAIQARPGTAEKDQHKKTSTKKSQKKKASDSQSRPGGGGSSGLSNNAKTQKVKGEGISVPKQGSKGSSAVKKNKDKTERDQSVNKENANRDDTKKSNRKKNKKSIDVTQKPHNAPLTGKSENSDQNTGNKTKEAGYKKGSSVQKTEQNLVQSSLNLKEDKQKIQTEEVTPKSGSELSKSKKRRIRKRRVLESLGIIVNAVKSPKDKTSTKKRKKKKKAKHSTIPDVSEDFLLKDNTTIKSVTVSSEINGLVTSRDKDSVCDTLGKKGAVRKCEETPNTTPKVKDTSNIHLKKTLDQVTKVKETKIEKKVLSENLLEVKGRHLTQDSNTSVKVCSSCEELQCNKQEGEESQISDSKILSEDIPHQSLNKKEESGKVDLVNFLSHDNVEGLFRSALLNDVTLSSRCSEKEVKNFFNTYGTFSERGRTQFAAVEKLLHSNKDSEDITTSQYFEPTLDKEVASNITPQHSNIIVNKESNLDSNSSAINLVGSQKCDYFSPKHINSDEPVSAASVSNLESSYNQVVKGLSRLESVGNNLVYKGGLSRGPIYTSPNLENRVTSSANSSQTLNSASKIFDSNAHESCNAKEEDKSASSGIPEIGKLDPPLVNTEKDLLGQEKIVDQFPQKDKTPSSEVVKASETNIKLIRQCKTKAKEELPIKDQIPCHMKVSDVKTVENEIDIVGSNGVIECTKHIEKSVTEILPDSSKDPVSICPSLNESKGSSWEKRDLENIPEKIENNCSTERYSWTGFVSESEEGTQETGFEATISVKSVIPIKKVEDSKNLDNSSKFTEFNSAASESNEDKELFDLAAGSVKERKEKTCDALPVYSSGKEVSDSTLLSSSSPSIEDQATMKSMQGKTTECTNFQKAEKSREEVKAAREAKKAEKTVRSKTKNTAAIDGTSKSTENAAVIKKQAVASPSKNKQSSRTSVDSGKSLNEPSTVCASLKEPALKNIDKSRSVEKDIKSAKDSSVKIPKIENEVAGKKKDLQEAKEVSEKKKEVPVSLKGHEINKTVETQGKIKVAESVVHGDPSVPTTTAGKSRAELRAERRVKQEQQRAVKAAQQVKVSQVKSAATGDSNLKNKQPQKDTGQHVNKKTVKVAVQAAKLKTREHRVKLFNHLYHERGPLAITENSMIHGPEVHPAVMKLGLQFADRIVVGSNARCIALLDALKQVIRDYETPPQKEFSRGLEAELQPSVSFLDCCRPFSVSMTNALRHLMRQMRLLPNNVSDSEAKKKLLETIDVYIREQIDVAAQAICNMVQKKIANGDVILIYGCSSLLQRILLEAHRSGTKFRVIVVDGRPWLEGREMLRWLVERGLDCSYVLVSAASFIMREVTKVLLGAHALLANGYVMSRAGSSQVALLGHSYNVPVLVCCETYKFCERVQTDSFVYNELGNPDDLIPKDSSSKEFPLSKWRSIESLTPLNLTYDVTPPDLVTAVVTELAILPCTSVPVILRIKPTETGC